MVPYLLVPLSKYIGSLRAFDSITLRSLCAAVTAFLICLTVGPGIILRLRALKLGERISSGSSWVELHHGKKGGTPTMGGMIFVLAALLGTTLFARFDTPVVLVGMWTMAAMAVLGGYDDRIKLMRIPAPTAKDPKAVRRGMDAKPKMFWQAVIGLVASTWLWIEMRGLPGWETFRIPAFPHATLYIGAGVIALGVLVTVATSNAVNLTDGLDGLAAGCGTIVVLVMTVVAYLVGRTDASAYLHQLFVPGAGELAVFLAAVAGAVGGFLWWNCHPAQIFMGNTGSQALGGALAVAAIGMRQEVLLFVAGFAFVWEAVSVILQVLSFKYRGGKRIFLITPFHHHLERLGWPESRVVMSFWIGSAFLGVVALGLTRAL